MLVFFKQLFEVFMKVAALGFLAIATPMFASATEYDVLKLKFNLQGTLSAEATAYITFYGYDSLISDQSATVVSRSSHKLNVTNPTAAVAVPVDAYLLIKPAEATIKETAKFYFSVFIDNDADGKICSTVDFMRDYKTSPWNSFRTVPTETVQVNLENVPPGFCPHD